VSPRVYVPISITGSPDTILTFRWLPKKLRKAEQNDGRRKWILQGVECECNSGEVLAM
jgi:hypothetical protein